MEEKIKNVEQKPKVKKVRSYYDYSLIFAILFLIIFGLIMIFSASSYMAELKFHDSGHFVKRQLIFAVLGFLIMIGFSMMNYKLWIKFAFPIYGVCSFLSLLVLFIGREANGAKRWLGTERFSFQPSELLKIGIIVFLAKYLVVFKDNFHSEDKKSTRKWLWLCFLSVIFPIGFVAKENWSTGIILFLIAFCMSFLGTSDILLHSITSGIMVFALIFTKPVVRLLYKYGITGNRLRRLVVWADPEKFSRSGGYQVLQGLYAIGSGNMFGKGLGQGLQKFFLPESQNDMIFAIIVEEIGLFGAALIMSVFAFIIFRLLIIAYSVKDPSAMYLVIGVMIHLSLQVILNIAVVTGVLPNTGVSLPFISYGGTSVIILLVEMSMVLSVARSIKMEY